MLVKLLQLLHLLRQTSKTNFKLQDIERLFDLYVLTQIVTAPKSSSSCNLFSKYLESEAYIANNATINCKPHRTEGNDMKKEKAKERLRGRGAEHEHYERWQHHTRSTLWHDHSRLHLGRVEGAQTYQRMLQRTCEEHRNATLSK